MPKMLAVALLKSITVPSISQMTKPADTKSNIERKLENDSCLAGAVLTTDSLIMTSIWCKRPNIHSLRMLRVKYLSPTTFCPTKLDIFSLPLFSYGGTALLLQMAEIGILLSISTPALHEMLYHSGSSLCSAFTDRFVVNSKISNQRLLHFIMWSRDHLVILLLFNNKIVFIAFVLENVLY